MVGWGSSLLPVAPTSSVRCSPTTPPPRIRQNSTRSVPLLNFLHIFTKKIRVSFYIENRSGHQSLCILFLLRWEVRQWLFKKKGWSEILCLLITACLWSDWYGFSRSTSSLFRYWKCAKLLSDLYCLWCLYTHGCTLYIVYGKGIQWNHKTPKPLVHGTPLFRLISFQA